jgi:hypothetical protein
MTGRRRRNRLSRRRLTEEGYTNQSPKKYTVHFHFLFIKKGSAAQRTLVTPVLVSISASVAVKGRSARVVCRGDSQLAAPESYTPPSREKLLTSVFG